MFDYMTVEEAAAKWDVSIQHVRVLCRKREVAGALKKGAMWFIPSESEHPIKERNRQFQFSGTKKKIFDSSIKLFSERSFDTITLKDIADQAGIAQSAVYRHFQSKQEILETVYGYFCYYYTMDRPSVEDLEPVILSGNPKEILQCVFYVFSPEYNNLIVDCTKIIFQRMSIDERAGEIFRNLLLKTGLDFAEQVYKKAIEAGSLPGADPSVLSVFANMIRLTVLLSWLAHADQKMHEDLQKSQDTLLDLIVKGLTVNEDRSRLEDPLP